MTCETPLLMKSNMGNAPLFMIRIKRRIKINANRKATLWAEVHRMESSVFMLE